MYSCSCLLLVKPHLYTFLENFESTFHNGLIIRSARITNYDCLMYCCLTPVCPCSRIYLKKINKYIITMIKASQVHNKTSRCKLRKEKGQSFVGGNRSRCCLAQKVYHSFQASIYHHRPSNTFAVVIKISFFMYQSKVIIFF